VTGPSERPKRKWRDLSAPQRAAIAGSAVVQVGLLAAALADLRRRPAKKVRGDKRIWTAVAFVNYVGPIAYFVYGRKR
jgi:phospholipase D-like protein